MRVFDSFDGLQPSDFAAPAALTIGVFDGVHRGHQALLGELRRWADEGGGAAIVLTFNRHPREVLSNNPPPALTSLSHRLRLLGRYGADAAVVLPFDEAWARTEAETFLELLHAHIAPRKLLLGANHTFGRGARGDAALAARHAETYGYEVRAFDLRAEGEVISSTRIRDAILRGELEEAETLLGRRVALVGEVIHGDARGRTIGFPTANLKLEQEAIPPRGVYAARVELEAGAPRLALVNIGRRPTFKEDDADLVEVHILGFSGELYGESLEVTFLGFLREERRFEGVEALVAQIERDRERAIARFGPQIEKNSASGD